jgi:hypothetical protein
MAVPSRAVGLFDEFLGRRRRRKILDTVPYRDLERLDDAIAEHAGPSIAEPIPPPAAHVVCPRLCRGT